MRLVVNGQERSCAPDRAPGSLAELWQSETGAPGPQGYAVALNGAVVRRDAWGATPLRDGDQVEIIRAVQGG